MAASDKYTVAIDCDGVIHSYTSPWTAPQNLPDPPVEGTIAWMNDMAYHFRIAVYTTRAQTPEGVEAVREYLFENGIGEDTVDSITDKKPPALVYIDDRAWRFTGPGSLPTTREIQLAKPWNKQ